MRLNPFQPGKKPPQGSESSRIALEDRIDSMNAQLDQLEYKQKRAQSLPPTDGLTNQIILMRERKEELINERDRCVKQLARMRELPIILSNGEENEHRRTNQG